jgi:hypothetical protein
MLRSPDYDGIAEVWKSAGRDVVPRAELAAKLVRDQQPGRAVVRVRSVAVTLMRRYGFRPVASYLWVTR